MSYLPETEVYWRTRLICVHSHGDEAAAIVNRNP